MNSPGTCSPLIIEGDAQGGSFGDFAADNMEKKSTTDNNGFRGRRALTPCKHFGSYNSNLSIETSPLSSSSLSLEDLGERVVIARPGLVVVKNAEGVTIDTMSTTNPLVMRFYPDSPVLKSVSREVTFCCRTTFGSSRSPLAMQLLKLRGIEKIKLTSEYIEITKVCHRHVTLQSERNCSVSWRNLKPKILATLMDYFAGGRPVLSDRASSSHKIIFDKDDSSLIIEDLINTRIRPVVKQEGGDVRFLEYRYFEGLVFLSFSGTCLSSRDAMTILRSIILQLLQFYVPGVDSIVEVSSPPADISYSRSKKTACIFA